MGDLSHQLGWQLEAAKRVRRDDYRRLIRRLAGPPQARATDEDVAAIKAFIDEGLVADPAQVEADVDWVGRAAAKAREIAAAQAELDSMPAVRDLTDVFAGFAAELAEYRRKRGEAEAALKRRRDAEDWLWRLRDWRQRMIDASPLALGSG
jgi:3',5'-cyclic AMP phosphodiesterase CpdA